MSWAAWQALVMAREGVAPSIAAVEVDPDVVRDIAYNGRRRCAVDRLPLQGHPRCAACTVLLGPEHETAAGEPRPDGALWCACCVAWEATIGARRSRRADAAA